MDREIVFSSNIKSIGYLKNVLEVEFKNGSVYQYLNVSEITYKSLMFSSSKGVFLSEKIKNNYRCIRVR